MLKINFEFVRGPHDGKVLHGWLGDSTDAERYFLFSNHGALGHRFKVASQHAVETLASEDLKDERPHNFQRHYYIITDRMEDDNEVSVRAEYLPNGVVRRGVN